MDDFYRDYILDHYRNPRNFGSLEQRRRRSGGSQPALRRSDPHASSSVDDGVVSDVRFSGKGCAISQASVSMLTERVKGMKLADIAKLSKDVVLEDVGIGISPTRMKCAMLGLRVLKSAAIGELAGWPDEE